MTKQFLTIEKEKGKENYELIFSVERKFS